MPKFTFDDSQAAWKSMSGKKWVRPIPVNMAGSIVRLFNDPTEDGGEVVYHDYDLDGRVVVGDQPSDKHLDNIIGGWTNYGPFKRIKPTGAVEEADVEQVEKYEHTELKMSTTVTEIPKFLPVPDPTFIATPEEIALAQKIAADDLRKGYEKRFTVSDPDAARHGGGDKAELHQFVSRDSGLVGRDQFYSHTRYDELVENTFDEIRNLGILKGGEYAGDLDRLANFRRNGMDLGVPMELVWRIYAAKHWDAIGQYVRDSIAGKERVRLESIEGRIDDLIVYLLLFKAMVDERGTK